MNRALKVLMDRLYGVFFYRVSLCLAALVLSSCQSAEEFKRLAKDEIDVPSKPNIIVLFADDMGYGDLGSYGNPNISTPELDSMAAEGQRWTNFYATSPVCSPSRGALMTGNYAERAGLWGRTRAVLFPGEQGQIPESTTTLAEALKDLGYDTAIFGKWHLGDQPSGLPTRHGFNQWLGIPYSNDMDWVVGPSSPEIFAAGARGDTDFVRQAIADRKTYSLNPKNEYWDIPLIESRLVNGDYEDRILARPPDQSRMTNMLTEEAVSYIEAKADAEEPFFLYLAYTMPHVPVFSSSDFEGVSAGGRYGDVIEEIDWSIGEIRDALEGQGISENSLVFFSSDNGPWTTMDQHSGSAGPFFHGKQTTFEGGLRVPGIFWGPGIVEPQVVHGIGTVMDIYPTALELAGGSLPPEVKDSIDLGPAIRGEDSPREEFAYYRFGQLYAYRMGSYKIHLITQGAYGLPPQRTVHETPLLYHLGEDPGEKFDLAAERPEILAEMLAAVEAHMAGMTVAEPIFEIGR